VSSLVFRKPLSVTWIWVCAGAVHLLLWVSLRTGWLCPLFNDTMHRFGPGADFFALYQAGYNARHGVSIYSFETGFTVIPYAYPFRYLPASAYFGILLTAVSPPLAYALWIGFCELCLLYNVRLTFMRTGGGIRGARLASLWLVFSPFFIELWIGQFTFLLSSLLFWCTLAEEEGKSKRALGWWIASVLWKPASLLWVPIWLRERRYLPGLALCAVLLACNGAYFLLFPGDWPVFLKTNVDPTPTWHAGNLGLSGLIYQFTGKGPDFRIWRLGLHAALVIPALWVTLGRNRKAIPFWLLGGLWTSLYFLVYKDVWEHHMMLLLPFLILALWRSPSYLLMGIFVLLALPSPFVLYDLRYLALNVDPQPYFTREVSIIHHSWRVVPILVLYGHWLRQAARLKAPESGDVTSSPACDADMKRSPGGSLASESQLHAG